MDDEEEDLVVAQGEMDTLVGGPEADEGIVVVKGGTGPAGASQERKKSVEQTPPMYLVVFSIKSDDNLGSLIRTAGAFGAREVLVVHSGRSAKRLRRALKTFGAHGAERRVPIRAFASLDKLVAWAKRPPRSCEVVGIEIDDRAASCYAGAQAFGRGACCFLPGNEGQGLLDRQLALCSRLVYVPHHGQATASLNVNAATAIVLSAFAHHANYAEAPRDNAKYEVDDRQHDFAAPGPSSGRQASSSSPDAAPPPEEEEDQARPTKVPRLAGGRAQPQSHTADDNNSDNNSCALM